MNKRRQLQLLSKTNRVLSFVYGKIASAIGLLGSGVSYLERLQRCRFEFEPRDDDIFIVTYPRSGTTWLQMILYQLTSDGAMDFAHINQKAPWYERSLRRKLDIDSLPSPRVFKTHLQYKLIPRGNCRYIYAIRDGRDVAVSYYHLYVDYNGFEGDFDTFLKRFYRGRVTFGTSFNHVRTWQANPANLNVLYLRYEEMQRDLPGTVCRIAEFCDIDLDNRKLERVLERSQFAFMHEHAPKFDFAYQFIAEQTMRDAKFLRKGESNGWTGYFSTEQLARFEQLERRKLAKTTR